MSTPTETETPKWSHTMSGEIIRSGQRNDSFADGEYFAELVDDANKGDALARENAQLQERIAFLEEARTGGFAECDKHKAQVAQLRAALKPCEALLDHLYGMDGGAFTSLLKVKMAKARGALANFPETRTAVAVTAPEKQPNQQPRKSP